MNAGMSMTMRKPMSVREFLDWEERQERRFEFDGFQPVAMTGGTSEHSLIQTNLITALGSRLRDGPCRVHGGHMKIATARGIRYPDAFVLCSPIPRGTTVIQEPLLVFEVLSPSTSGTDRIVKVREYGATPSIRRYVILEQTRQAATVFSWDSGQWAGIVIADDAELALPEIDLALPLADLYRNVDFPPDEDADRAE